jgi:hypothetical protein
MAGAIDPRGELKAEQAAIARARWEWRVQFVFGECVLDTGR